MKSYAVVNIQTGIVDNAVVWDGITPYLPPDGFMLIEIPMVEPMPGIDWTYIDGVWSEPVLPAAPEPIVPGGPSVLIE